MKIEVELHSFGDYLNWQMQRRRASTREVAAATGMNPSTVWRIAQGKNFDLRHLIPLAKWARLTPNELWNLLEETSVNTIQTERKEP